MRSQARVPGCCRTDSSQRGDADIKSRPRWDGCRAKRGQLHVMWSVKTTLLAGNAERTCQLVPVVIAKI